MSGTEVGYAATDRSQNGTGVRSMPIQVLLRTCLRACYAMSGTDLACVKPFVGVAGRLAAAKALSQHYWANSKWVVMLLVLLTVQVVLVCRLASQPDSYHHDTAEPSMGRTVTEPSMGCNVHA
eukprot:3935941-Rhodomonas_salina.2